MTGAVVQHITDQNQTKVNLGRPQENTRVKQWPRQFGQKTMHHTNVERKLARKKAPPGNSNCTSQ